MKPIYVEVSDGFADGLDTAKQKHGISKRHAIETALRFYLNSLGIQIEEPTWQTADKREPRLKD